MNTIFENFKNIITNKYAKFTGKANRTEFWQYVLVYFMISVAFLLLMSLAGGANMLRMIFMTLYVIVVLALLVPSLAVSVRRMHDIGISGSWIFINLIPFVGFIWFLVLVIEESEPTTNQFKK